MMKAFVFCALGLVACTPGTNTITTIATFETDVQAATVAACGVEPTVASIAALISSNPGVTLATDIAGLVCKAVSLKGHKLRAKVQSPVVINGVTIHFQPLP